MMAEQLPAKAIHESYISPIPIPPGATIKEMADIRGMSQTELARRMGRPGQAVSEIINGKKAIIEDTAFQLERVFGQPAEFWLNLERNFQLSKARFEERARLARQVRQVKQYPFEELVQFGYIKETEALEEKVSILLNFLRVADFVALNGYIKSRILAFRRSPQFDLSIAKLATWLRMGEIEAENLNLQPFNKQNLREHIPEIRHLTTIHIREATERLRSIGEECGVAFLFIREFNKFPVCGITRWVGNNPYIQLSLRYKRHDSLWFSIFHEIGHVLLHGKKDLFIDNGKKEDTNKYEKEANQFARESLGPSMFHSELVEICEHSLAVAQPIIQTAEELDIHPGIIVGMLQYDGVIPYNRLHKLKLKLIWS